MLPGVGPVNRSMGGAARAAPLDAAGPIHWNPATMSGLPSSEVVVGFELLYLSPHVETAFESTRSDSGVSPLPTLAIAWQPGDSPWTFGLEPFAIGGFETNYPSANTPLPLAFEPIYSRLQVLQLVPSVSLKLTDRLSVGFGPTISMADASLRRGVGCSVGATLDTWQVGSSMLASTTSWHDQFE